MIKTIELIIVITLLIFSFFAGVKYSDSVKNHASWLFEVKDEEVELPDLSGDNTVEIVAPASESSEVFNGNGQEVPMDDLGTTNGQNQGSQQPQHQPAPVSPNN